ncbi:hypothetical protein NE865_16020 [Phthorimaea operculella]|nr:hypothetical protein NE865_16020 [Phthorimaea operculella]
MIKTQRSPPPTPRPSQGPEEIPATPRGTEPPAADSGNSNINFNRGVKCLDTSSIDSPTDKEEIKELLKTWKADQDLQLGKLIREISDLKAQNANIDHSLNFISQQYEDMKKKLIEVKNERDMYMNSLIQLSSKISDLETLSRPSSIEIRNVPILQNENHSGLNKVVHDLAKSLPVQIPPTSVHALIMPYLGLITWDTPLSLNPP